MSVAGRRREPVWEMLSALPSILEETVLKSCEKELERLLENTDKNAAGTSIEEALEELYGLSEGTKPNYTHPWVPLLHASWYHLRHVKFCLNTVYELLKEPVRSGEPIGILDFGCGTMPLQWAAAVAIAAMVIKDKLSIPNIRIVNIDESEPMNDLGCDMWEDVQTVVEQKQKTGEEEIRPLYSVMQEMKAVGSVNPAESGFSANDNLHLITVIHAVYKDAGKFYWEHIKPLIKDRPTPKILFTANKPGEHWFTTHNTMQNQFRQVKMDPTWSSIIVERDLEVKRDLKNLTDFRRRMYSDFCQSNTGSIAKRFLCQDVTWEHGNPPIGFIMTAR